jgi:hypothetical protein
MALTPRRELFAQEYLKDLNATQAARRAGYARVDEGARLLADGAVQARIAQLQGERTQRLRIEADEVLNELLAVVRMNPDQVKKLRYADKLKALELCLRHMGMLHPDSAVQVNTTVTLGGVDVAERILRARKRAGIADERRADLREVGDIAQIKE